MNLFHSQRISITSLIFVPSLLSAVVANGALISFTTGEGYIDGTLAGQASGSWGVSNNTSLPFAVDATAGSVNLNTTLNSRIAGYNQALDFNSSGGFSSYINFSFVQGTATVAANSSAAGLIYSDTAISGSISTSTAAIGRTTTLDGYRLILGNTFISFAGSAIGIDSATNDLASDVLRMTLNLSQGASSSTWLGNVTLFNVTQNTLVATRSSSVVDIGSNDPTTIYNSLFIGASMASSGLSSFSILDYSAPTAIPEASCVLLFKMGALGLLCHRRRRGA